MRTRRGQRPLILLPIFISNSLNFFASFNSQVSLRPIFNDRSYESLINVHFLLHVISLETYVLKICSGRHHYAFLQFPTNFGFFCSPKPQSIQTFSNTKPSAHCLLYIAEILKYFVF